MKNKNKKILIITDHKWRDLAGYVYLKLLLEKNNNIKVRLCRLGEDKFWVFYDKPDVVVYNHLWDESKVRFAHWLKRQNVRIIILPTEGIPYYKKFLEYVAGRFTDLSPTDLYLSWNEPVTNKIIELGKLPSEKIKIIGVPRFDFYLPPLTKLMPSKANIQEKYALQPEPDAPIILYATNFTIASLSNNRTFLYNDWENLKCNRIEGFTPENTENLIKWETLTRSLTIQSMKHLLEDFPNIQIIYKPHPAENHLFYRSMVKEFENKFPGRFAFVVREYIWNLLNISDVLLQRTCLTAFEAWILNKPTLQLQLHPDEFYLSEEHSKGSDIVYNYENIRERVAFYVGNGKIADSIKAHRTNCLEKWCYRLDGKRTIETASIIAQFLQADEKTRYSFSKEEFLSYYLKEYLKQILKFGRNYVRKQFIGVDRLGRIDKQFSEKDSKYWQKQIASIISSH